MNYRMAWDALEAASYRVSYIPDTGEFAITDSDGVVTYTKNLVKYARLRGLI